ncbi:MAG: hypothetical protein IPL61_18975 [Myxococcales bacterium]|nr:hypothetical protein [Myxococcales bacterium]
MKPPKRWRLIVVDEQPYLWTVRVQELECARPLTVHVHRAEVVDDVVRRRAYLGAMATTIAGPSHCGGPQGRQLDPPEDHHPR